MNFGEVVNGLCGFRPTSFWGAANNSKRCHSKDQNLAHYCKCLRVMHEEVQMYSARVKMHL